ncbi:hypothetical protein DSO57_1024204 [Entomophthora muscae]|uniref:Uncharacterized protein n=1 Tax=Entomophthora muscae TaxID=34485 RepID=A0ACC2T2Q9_9FUNG|nr:hypothetical protein DSO57_1024204 [Entomophthora muscae]
MWVQGIWVLGFKGSKMALGLGGRIDNSFTLETRARVNPGPKSPQAAGPGDQGAAFLRFPGVEPLQAEAKNDGSNGEASQTKGIIAPNEGVIKAPNGGNKIPNISFMSLKSTLVANQDPSLEEGTGLWPNPMTTTLEQDNQVANSSLLTNERIPGPSAILLPLNPSTQINRPTFPNSLKKPLWKILSLEVGCYIDPRTSRTKLIAIFE